MTVKTLIALLEAHGADENEVLIDAGNAHGNGLTLLVPMHTRMRGGKLLIVADQVT